MKSMLYARVKTTGTRTPHHLVATLMLFGRGRLVSSPLGPLLVAVPRPAHESLECFLARRLQVLRCFGQEPPGISFLKPWKPLLTAIQQGISSFGSKFVAQTTFERIPVLLLEHLNLDAYSSLSVALSQYPHKHRDSFAGMEGSSSVLKRNIDSANVIFIVPAAALKLPTLKLLPCPS
eukprot:340629-Hanusia_phi.AAC.1